MKMNVILKSMLLLLSIISIYSNVNSRVHKRRGVSESLQTEFKNIQEGANKHVTYQTPKLIEDQSYPLSTDNNNPSVFKKNAWKYMFGLECARKKGVFNSFKLMKKDNNNAYYKYKCLVGAQEVSGSDKTSQVIYSNLVAQSSAYLSLNINCPDGYGLGQFYMKLVGTQVQYQAYCNKIKTGKCMKYRTPSKPQNGLDTTVNLDVGEFQPNDKWSFLKQIQCKKDDKGYIYYEYTSCSLPDHTTENKIKELQAEVDFYKKKAIEYDTDKIKLTNDIATEKQKLKTQKTNATKQLNEAVAAQKVTTKTAADNLNKVIASEREKTKEAKSQLKKCNTEKTAIAKKENYDQFQPCAGRQAFENQQDRFNYVERVKKRNDKKLLKTDERKVVKRQKRFKIPSFSEDDDMSANYH